MRLFQISYRDRNFPHERTLSANRYTMPEAREMAGVLGTLGCADFEYVPVKSDKPGISEVEASYKKQKEPSDGSLL